MTGFWMTCSKNHQYIFSYITTKQQETCEGYKLQEKRSGMCSQRCLEPSPLFQVLHFTDKQQGFVSSGEIHLRTSHVSQPKHCWVPLKFQYSLLPLEDRQLPASALLQVVSWLPLALQQYALRINKQMQLRLRQAVLFLPKKSLHLHRTVTTANSNKIEVISQICCWFRTFERFFFSSISEI